MGQEHQIAGKLLYQGHASLRITVGKSKVIYIDPFLGDGYEKAADLILVTHQHPDHNAIHKPKQKSDCIVWQNTDALVDGQYLTWKFGDITVRAVEAYNAGHPKEIGVGYIISFDGIKIYIAGDTAVTAQMPELADEHIDYALLPIDGIYTMRIGEAEACAELIRAKHIIPYHTAVPPELFNREAAERFTASGKIIMEPGEIIDLIRE